MNLEAVLNFRRSIRDYQTDNNLDTAKVKHCLELATLAPNSSNMQLWEFYHITDKELIQKMAYASLSQNAVASANQLVVFVTRGDLYRSRAKQVLDFQRDNIKRNSPPDRQASRIKKSEVYYGKLMPLVYARFFGLVGLFRKMITVPVSLFRPMFTNSSECDQRIVVHKSCALAAQTFMIAMANEGYDTCAVEGFDSRRVKKLLNLPSGAEINMLIPCGIRNGEKAVHGERYRVPFHQVYKEI
ncbi:MAG: nitroreductase family protein [Bacteroidales bacterium]|jgi:nitroreductase|nr:nitroreductase family protein [Bacteroidales bacterium]